MKQTIVLSICLLCNIMIGFGQKRPPLSIPKPKGVKASDGDYPDKIKISWDQMGSDFEYLVERKGTGPISEWIKSTFIGDYDKNIKPGQKYSYSVRARKGNQVSELSEEDSGFIMTIADPNERSKPNPNPPIDTLKIKQNLIPPIDSLNKPKN